MESQQRFHLRWNDHNSKMAHDFIELRRQGDFLDVTLVCEGHAIKGHKVVLSFCSSYFKRVLRDNPCKHPIVILKDVKLVNMEVIVNFMYTGEIGVTQEQLATIFDLAETFEVEGLVEIIKEHERMQDSSSAQVVCPPFADLSHCPGNLWPAVQNGAPESAPPPKRRKRAYGSSIQNLPEGEQLDVFTGNQDNAQTAACRAQECQAGSKNDASGLSEEVSIKIERQSPCEFLENDQPSVIDVPMPIPSAPCEVLGLSSFAQNIAGPSNAILAPAAPPNVVFLNLSCVTEKVPAPPKCTGVLIVLENGSQFRLFLDETTAEKLTEPTFLLKYLQDIKSLGLKSELGNPTEVDLTLPQKVKVHRIVSDNGASIAIDAGVEVSIEESCNRASLKESSSSFQWTDAAIKLLLSLVEEREAFMPFTSKRKRNIWNEINQAMIAKGFAVSYDKVYKKWANLYQTYKVIVDRIKQTGPEDIKWLYFDTIDKMLADMPVVKPSEDSLSSSSIPSDRNSPTSTLFSSKPSTSTCTDETIKEVPSQFQTFKGPRKLNRKMKDGRKDDEARDCLPRDSSPPDSSDLPGWFRAYVERKETADKEWRAKFLASSKKTIAIKELAASISTLAANKKSPK